MDKKFCDLCGKQMLRNWIVLKHVYKEMDFGLERNVGTCEICGKDCLIKYVDVWNYTPLERLGELHAT